MKKPTQQQQSFREQVREQLVELLGGAIGSGTTRKEVSSTPNFIRTHGPGGLFSSPGLDSRIFSAMSLPRQGLAGRLPVKPSVFTNPTYGLLTGVSASTGAKPAGDCDPAPQAGTREFCTWTAPFGKIRQGTRTFDILQFGKRVNRADMIDLKLLNPSTLMDGNKSPLAPNIPNTPIGQAIVNDVAALLFDMTVSWIRDHARLTYTGNPANNTVNGGYMEFKGLELLIAANYVNTINGNPCPSAYSIVVDFAGANISDPTTGNAALASLYNSITATYRALKSRAARSRLAPTKWVITMQETLHHLLVDYWACTYSTTRCRTFLAAGSDTSVTVEGSKILEMRDAMWGDTNTYEGQYLMIDGERVEVVLDEAIPVTYGTGPTAGQETSDINFVPLTVLNGMEVTYWDYFDYTTPGGPVDAGNAIFGANNQFYKPVEGGRFMQINYAPNGLCNRMEYVTEPRIVMHTPFLAARIDNVTSVPGYSTRSPFPGDPTYVSGGAQTGNTTWYPA